jgi:adenosine 3'-phospho 5'-phosphosulfate transporter B2
MLSLVLYGLLQERIMQQPYYDPSDESKLSPEYFRSSAFLVLNNRVIAVLIAIIMLCIRSESLRNKAPIHKFALVSVSNTVATFCQYEALKYVSFPTQTLGKCGKIIPVMILGMTLSGKQYSWKEFLIAIVVTAGCALFVLTGADTTHKEKNDTIYGLLLMVLYLFSDGFTSTLQEKLLKGTDVSTYNQMLYVNLCSAVLSLASLLFTSELISSLDFSYAHPDFLLNSLFLSLTSTGGQVVILLTIKEFGALFFATVMTIRQVISILLSCLIYLHPLTIGQWISAAVVFGAIYYKDVVMRAKHGHSHAPPPTQPTEEVEKMIPLETIRVEQK